MPCSESACFLILAVTDTGVGISQDALRSLFQPYGQIRPGALQEGKGSGLGLSICKKIVELHGGGVLVSSKAGEGSTFSFEVPVQRLEEEKIKALMAKERELADDGGAPRGGIEEESKGELPAEDGGDDGPALFPINLDHPSLETPEQATRTVFSPFNRSSDSSVTSTSSPVYNAASAMILPPPFATTSRLADAAALSVSFVEALGQPEPVILETNETLQSHTAQSVRLPARRLATVATASAAGQTPSGRKRVVGEEQKAGVLGDGHVLRALVVEDSAVNRKLLCMMCTGLGLKVDAAEDGQDAYDKIAGFIAERERQQLLPSGEPGAPAEAASAASPLAVRSPTSNSSATPTTPDIHDIPVKSVPCQYDVIFLDDHMPRMTGVECVAALRALGITIPVFGVTANALLEDQQRFVRAGATAVVTKPMTKKQVMVMVATASQIKEEAGKAQAIAVRTTGEGVENGRGVYR